MMPIQASFPPFLTLPIDLTSLIYIMHETPEGRNPRVTGSRNQRETFRGQTGLKLEFSLQNWFSQAFRTYGHCFFT